MGYLKSIIWECGRIFVEQEGWQDGVNMGVGFGFNKYYALLLQLYVCVEWFLHMLISTVSSFFPLDYLQQIEKERRSEN